MQVGSLVRETMDDSLKQTYIDKYPELNPDFIFAFPAYNVRNNEIGAVLGRNQLKRLDNNNQNVLHHAVSHQNFELIDLLLNPASVNSTFDKVAVRDNIFNKGNIIPDPLQMKFRECSDSFSGGIFKLR